VVPDDDHVPELMVFWGSNPVDCSAGLRREGVRTNLLKGAKLVMIDPKRIDFAKRADMWIGLRPNSDGAFAMGLLKVIVEEKLYDEDYVANGTVGFDKLQGHVGTFTLEDVERVTWVAKETIAKFARLYAQSRPAMIQMGNGVEQGVNCFQAIRAISILMGICGNVGVPGGQAFVTPPPYTRPGRFYLPKEFPRFPEERAVGKEFKMAMRNAYIPTQSFMTAVLEEKPYPIKAAMGILTDPLVSYPDTERVYKTFMKLELFVMAEIFPTPSTAVADIVLPAAWGAEHDTVGYWPGWYQDIRAYPKLVNPPGEAEPDSWWLTELAKRLGFGDSFWKGETEVLDFILAPSGLTWEEFKEKRILEATFDYKKPGEYRTPSGKVEIYSEQLKELGYSPIPLWGDLIRFRFEPTDKYPLLMTNRKEESYMLTGYKHVEYHRQRRPQPTADMNPEIAREVGLKEGDWAYIETPKGRIKQKVALDPDLDPRLISVAFGWWFPEEGETADLFQFRRSNINVLTDDSPPNDPQVGSIELRGVPCRVYKAE
jgi:anaerobic selenocysteine-containing dehydrogenase